jgi:hypothetical protein
MEKLRRTGGAGRNQQRNFGWKDSIKNCGNYGLRRSIGKIRLAKE